MLDAALRPLIDPISERAARRAIAYGATADRATWMGFAAGLLAILAIALGAPLLGLALFLVNRAMDGLDGAIARIQGPTDRGGYLDITLDFLVYSGLIFAFAVLDPEANALPAAFLVWSFVGTGGSFLAYASIAAKRGLSTEIRGRKSLYYLGGLAEGFETILCIIAMTLFPSAFPAIAWTFAALCWITTATRVYAGWRDFG